MEFFDLDKQISKIGLKAVGIGDNSTTAGGLIGFCNDSGVLGSGALTNTYVTGILPDLYLIFYAVASFVITAGILFYFLYMLGPLNAYGLVLVFEILKRVIIGSILVGCSLWILGWAVEFTDALTAMFGLNNEIMVFVVDMFTSAYSCIFILMGVVGIYLTAALYVLRAEILGSLELIFIISVICWMFGAIELNICKNIESMGAFLIRLMLYGLFLTPVMSLCYGIGMGIMMSPEEPTDISMFVGIMVLIFSIFVPMVLFFKFVYNPVPIIAKGAYIAAKIK